MQNEKVSIVIPVYKGESTLERCVDSIENGDYKNIEIILVNDCSPDNSAVVLNHLQEKYKNMIVHQNDVNKGVSYTRNQGIMRATGKYLMFVDCDDWVSPDYVSSFIGAIEENGVTFVVSGYVNHDEVFNHRIDYFGYKQEVTISKYTLGDHLLRLYDNRLLQQLWNKVFITDVVKKFGIAFDETISMGEDFRFILQYLHHANLKNFVFINKGLYHYIRDNANSLMSSFGKEGINEPLKNLSMMLTLLPISENERTVFYEQKRCEIIGQYAYRIVHTKNTSFYQKGKKVKSIAGREWMRVFIKNEILLVKEEIARIYAKKK